MEKVICEDFRFNVNDLLSRKGWSRSDLARALECSPAYVSQVLNGAQEPGLRVLERFASALDVTASRLVKKIAEPV